MSKYVYVTTARNDKKIPTLLWVVLGFTLLACVVTGRLSGFNVSGFSWVIPLAWSLFILVQNMGKVSFPVWIWLPWTALLLMYLVISDTLMLDSRVSPTQRTIQLLTPVFVGMAISSYRLSPDLLDKCVHIFRTFAYLLFAGSVLSALASILNLQRTGLAMQVMTSMLLAIFFINKYLFQRQIKDLHLYIVLLSLPVLAITRTVMLVVLLAIPISFGPMSFARRITFVGFGMIVALWLFSLPQVQEKMFFSGHGELSDISLDNPDFATSGRSRMWRALYASAENNFWAGYGTGASESFTYKLSNLAYPHNDWLLTYFDFGMVGVLIYLLTNIVMLLHCLKSARRTHNQTIKLFFVAGASSFIPFMLVMFTDNIMVYASYFGNLQYLIIGLAYGALRGEQDSVMIAGKLEQGEG